MFYNGKSHTGAMNPAVGRIFLPGKWFKYMIKKFLADADTGVLYLNLINSIMIDLFFQFLH